MHAVQLSAVGAPDGLALATVPLPVPKAGEARVRVHAAGINFADTRMRQGNYAVKIPVGTVLGSEVSGVIDALGPPPSEPVSRGAVSVGQDQHFKIGDRVAVPLFATGSLTGGYAAPVAFLVSIPDAVDFATATALQVQGLTASFLLQQVVVTERSVLIHSAAGGTGSLLLQLAQPCRHSSHRRHSRVAPPSKSSRANSAPPR